MRHEWVLASVLAASLALPTIATAQTSTSTPALDETGVVGEESARGLSWDIMGGGVPSAGALAQLELGFSGLPRLSYHYTLDPKMSLGGMVTFDYAYWAPKLAFTPALLLQVPLRYSLIKDDTISLGVRADPGLGFFFKGPSNDKFAFAVLLNASIIIGVAIQDRMMIGGGVDLPASVVFQHGVDFVLPVLIGPIFELHVTPPLAMTLDFKIGPIVLTEGDSNLFGFKLMAGVAYRL